MAIVNLQNSVSVNQEKRLKDSLEFLELEHQLASYYIQRHSSRWDGLATVEFYFLYKNQKLQVSFLVHFARTNKEKKFVLSEVSDEEIQKKILDEKQKRIDACELELYCVSLIKKFKGQTITIQIQNIGNIEVRINTVFSASGNQDTVKKADVVIGITVQFQNQNFFSSTLAHSLGLQVKTSEYGQTKHVEKYPLVPSIHMKENDILLQKEVLIVRLRTIIKKAAQLRSIEFLQALIFNSTSTYFSKVNKELSFITSKLVKEIHK